MAGFVLVATPMIARLLSWAMLAVAVVGAAACGGIAAGEPSPSKKQDPGLSSGGPPRGSENDQPRRGPVPAPPPVPQTCCPFDQVPNGTMHLGGGKLGGECVETSDFWCSTNWRIELDASYCAKWVYDVRKPAPDEDAYCQAPKVCTPGAYVFCRCADASEATKLCKDDGHSFEPCSPCP